MGSFDGVHVGHRRLLRSVLQYSEESGLPSAVIIFEPQPYEYFAKSEAPARLSRLREKVRLLLGYGIDTVICLKFDQTLRSLTADAYIESVIVKAINAKHIVVGDDFKFGCDRSGDFLKLRHCGKRLGFSVADTETQTESTKRISSTRIRNLLAEADIENASKLLGRPFSVYGRVFYGNQLGSKIGFPTANITLGRFNSPVNGVFAVKFKCENTKSYVGVANVGVRPSIKPDGRRQTRPILEVHIFDFNQDIYGQFAEVEFCKKIRSEKKFDNIESLKTQIKLDKVSAKQYFATSIE